MLGSIQVFLLRVGSVLIIICGICGAPGLCCEFLGVFVARRVCIVNFFEVFVVRRDWVVISSGYLLRAESV